MIRILRFFALGVALDWLTSLSLVFGGCCSNALTLELITSQYPPFGTLITFAQFLFVTIAGLPKHLSVKPSEISSQEVYKRVATLIRRSNSKSNKDSKPRRTVIAVLDHDIPRDFSTKFIQGLSKFLEDSLQVKSIVSDHSGNDTLGVGDQKHHDKSQGYPSQIEIRKLSDSFLEDGKEDTEAHDILLILQKNSEREPLHSRLLNTSCMVLELAREETRRFVVRYPTRSKIVLNPFRYRLKPRRIPLSSYLIQVIMFLLISLLNNAAFAYQIPMSVHIVFRSGGPVVNMILGWTLRKTRYTKMQVMSIVVVTIGICLTTLSSMASKPSKPRFSSTHEFSSSSVEESLVTFAIGISILSAALVLSGFLGLVQDDTFRRYGRGNWEESMFYLHAMALPMFSFVGSELGSQVRLANASPTIKANIPSALHTLGLRPLEPSNNEPPNLAPLPFLPIRLPSLNIPSVYVPLFANLLTQFVCVSGVNRLSSRVNSLTVTLILAVRKAASLAISVVLVGNSKGNTYLWAGALAVLLGTIGYAAGSSSKRKSKAE